MIRCIIAILVLTVSVLADSSENIYTTTFDYNSGNYTTTRSTISTYGKTSTIRSTSFDHETGTLSITRTTVNHDLGTARSTTFDYGTGSYTHSRSTIR